MSPALVTQVLAAVRAFVAEHGSLPSNSHDYAMARLGDRRYPSWPTIRRAGFRSMSDLGDTLGISTEGAHWGRGRVIEALQRYAAEHGAISGSAAAWHQATRFNRRWPTYYGVLKYFASFEEAARVAGVPVQWAKQMKRTWTNDEDAFLRAFVGTCTVAELARALDRHTPQALDRRIYDLRLTQRTGQGRWTMLRASQALGMHYSTLQTLGAKGIVQLHRQSHFAFLDPGEIPDWLLVQGTEELRAAALRSRRLRLAEIVATKQPLYRSRVGGVLFGPVERTEVKMARLGLKGEAS